LKDADRLMFQGDKHTNNRRDIRVQPETASPIRIDLMGRDFIEVTHATDISLQGVGIQVLHGFKGYDLHDKVELLIMLPIPVSHSIRTAAHVVHLQGDLFGIEYENLQREDYKKVHQYIAYRLENETLNIKMRHALRRIIS